MNVLLIPSAILIPKEMRKSLGDIPMALYPLNNLPMIDHLYYQYKDIVDEIFIVTYKKSDLIKDYIKYKKLNIHTIDLDYISDLGYTIKYGINAIFTKYKKIDSLIINYADTLVNDSKETNMNSCFYDLYPSNDSRWTYFSQKKGIIIDIKDKDESNMKIENIQKTPVFIGVFSFKNPKLLLNLLKKNKIKDNFECDSFYKALIEYSNEENIAFIKSKKWFDVGHSENYLKAKTGVEARSFNALNMDTARGIIKKTSKNKDKFLNEIKWYIKLPNKLQYLSPRIYSYSTDYENPFVSMEYYGYNTLHELLLFGNLPLYKWQNIFQKLLFIINDMEKYTISENLEEKKSAMYDIYVKKTKDRLLSLQKEKEFKDFFEKNININNIKYHSLNYYIKKIDDISKKYILNPSEVKFNIIHGDLCFSNILIESNYSFMRIIDPRGEFGTFDIYGDQRYELAKLLHSLDGKYDFIIEDMFHVAVIGTNIEYSIEKKADSILNIFKDVFRDKIKDYKEIQFIEATLFLSMIPLHSNSLKRQYAMLATGIMLLDNILKEF